jgi:diacylglycerol kinase (ATP)
MGTGNDLARTLGIPLEPDPAVDAILKGRVRSVDVWSARSPGADRLFINACMGGFPVEVDRAIEGPMKERLGAVAFWVGGAKAMTGLTRYEVKAGNQTWSDVLAVGVGNGRTAGGGIAVFPDAQPDDGRLAVCGFGADSVAEGVKLVTRLRAGEHTELPSVHAASADNIRIDATPELEFNVDGELVGMVTPVEFAKHGSVRLRIP